MLKKVVDTPDTCFFNMLCKIFLFLSFILLGDVVNCQSYVAIATDRYVLYQHEKLPFTCSPTGAALSATITDITLWKNSTSGWKEIVKIWSKIENSKVVNEIDWTNNDVKKRATVIKQKVSPSNQAGLQIEIRSMSVNYSDKGDYKCSISGNSSSDSIDSESGSTPVTITGAINISSGNLFPNPIIYFVLCIMYSSIL